MKEGCRGGRFSAPGGGTLLGRSQPSRVPVGLEGRRGILVMELWLFGLEACLVGMVNDLCEWMLERDG